MNFGEMCDICGHSTGGDTGFDHTACAKKRVLMYKDVKRHRANKTLSTKRADNMAYRYRGY